MVPDVVLLLISKGLIYLFCFHFVSKKNTAFKNNDFEV